MNDYIPEKKEFLLPTVGEVDIQKLRQCCDVTMTSRQFRDLNHQVFWAQVVDRIHNQELAAAIIIE